MINWVTIYQLKDLWDQLKMINKFLELNPTFGEFRNLIANSWNLTSDRLWTIEEC